MYSLIAADNSAPVSLTYYLLHPPDDYGLSTQCKEVLSETLYGRLLVSSLKLRTQVLRDSGVYNRTQKELCVDELDDHAFHLLCVNGGNSCVGAIRFIEHERLQQVGLQSGVEKLARWAALKIPAYRAVVEMVERSREAKKRLGEVGMLVVRTDLQKVSSIALRLTMLSLQYERQQGLDLGLCSAGAIYGASLYRRLGCADVVDAEGRPLDPLDHPELADRVTFQYLELKAQPEERIRRLQERYGNVARGLRYLNGPLHAA
ncbi:GNAT family N-acetyltransferase [Gloeobacter violaceus]|uniref:Gll1110 protein n=1 Tax=Gloeobacter violaceus (strain ATCC 29082 / PCC 7421) TaxID=251221 RepID=Q7NLL3_GLOVI|nr:GNAT family N-acetyltransferase [Gloeobacter violaceus]BAC89051.1 gll1110 [Gloeobacter violaceus PCC 7421]